MKKTYNCYLDAIMEQTKDFQLVQNTKLLPDGKVEVTGWGVGEKGFPAAEAKQEDFLDQLIVRSAIITDKK
jgi:hypothetical protein